MGTVAVVVLLLLLAWFFWPGAATHSTRVSQPREDIDRAELEEAEREVQEASDEHSVRDWGPGASKPPI